MLSTLWFWSSHSWTSAAGGRGAVHLPGFSYMVRI